MLDSGADYCAFYVASSIYNRFYRYAQVTGSIFAVAQTRNATGNEEPTLHILSTARNPLLVEIEGLRNPIAVACICVMKSTTFSKSAESQPRPQTLIGRGKGYHV